MKLSIFVVAIVAVLALTMVLEAGAFSVTMTTDGVSIKNEFSLAYETSLQSHATFADGGIIQSTEASGPKHNALSTLTGSAEYGAQAAVSTDGKFSASTVTSASKEGAVLFSNLAGTNSAMEKVSGVSGTNAAGQQAAMFNGALNSAQMVSVSASEGVVSSAKNQMAGDGGFISSAAISKDNTRFVAASLKGSGGDMGANLFSTAGKSADIDGTLSTAGISGIRLGLQKNDPGVVVNGLYPASDGGLGEFNMISVNLKGSKGSAGGKIQPSKTYYQNNAKSYALAGWRWGSNPNLAFSLYTDAKFQRTSLNAGNTRNVLASAAATWDAATSQKLFSGSITTASSGLSLSAKDGKNTIGWLPISGGALAYTRTYLKGIDSKGYYIPSESDVCFNSNYKWVTSDTAKSFPLSSNTFDVQTVALHEIGHTYGMGDLYTLPSTDPRYGDYSEIMNSYNDKQRTLGNGDIAGIRTLYGA